MSRQKESMRLELRQWRDALSPEVVTEASEKIVQHCTDLVRWQAIASLHTYLPNKKQHEIDTWLLLRYLWKSQPHMQTMAPVMNGSGMLSYSINESTEIHISKFGIPEPIRTIQTKTTTFGAIIVPVMGYNAGGYRLGYGYGHYDRFLAKVSTKTITVGLAYADSEREFTPESHDVPLDYIVTEKGVVNYMAFH